MGLRVGPVPARVDASVKAGLLDLIDHAADHGWHVDARAGCSTWTKSGLPAGADAATPAA